MRPRDFFHYPSGSDPSLASEVLHRDLLEQVIRGPLHNESDITVAEAVVKVLHQELEGYATSGGRLESNDEDLALLLRAVHVACSRVGVEPPKLPFRTFDGFYRYWRREGMSGGGSWAIRREYVASVFEPIEAQLEQLQLRAFEDALADPISPWRRTGWPAVDVEISELRQRFETATTAQGCSAVGNACVRVLEAVADAAFDPNVHMAGRGGDPPPRDKTKDRLTLVVRHHLQGSEAEEMRRLALAAISVAHQVKHRPAPTRQDAGIAADATILVANLIRRLRQP